MGKKRGAPSGQYTNEFKVEAVRLAESVGGCEAARRLDMPDSSIWNWIKLSRAGKLVAEVTAVGAVKRSVNELESENARLRREFANAKLDLEIVNKAAVYFAKESR
jgi:transposase